MHTHALKFKQIKKYYESTVNVCKETGKENTLCGNFIKVTEPVIQRLQVENEALELLLGQNRTTKRLRRGLINAIGKVTKVLFGNLDDDDAEYYNSRINQFTKNEHTLAQTIKEQSHVIQTTISNFNNTIGSLDANEKVLKENVEKISEYLKQGNSNLHELELRVNLNEHFPIFLMIYQQYQQETNVILSAITSAQLGQLHPFVIAPNKLMLELQHILTYNNVHFPVTPTLENAHIILKTVSLDVFYKQGNLIYIVSVPLVDIQQYEIYKLTPLPVLLSANKYVFIQPSTKFLAINEVRQRYLLISENQFDKCISYDEFNYICKQQQPIYLTHNHEMCEVRLFHSTEYVPDNCDKRIVQLENSIWNQLTTSNTWLFVLVQPEKITLTCNEKVYNVLVKGVGSIKLVEQCKVFTEAAMLIAHATFSSTMLDNQFIPSVNLIDDCCEENAKNKLSKLNLSTIKLNPTLKTLNLHLDDLNLASIKLSELDDKVNNIYWLPTSLITSYGFYLYLVIILIMLCCCYYCCCCKRIIFRKNCCKNFPNICIKLQQNIRPNSVNESRVHYTPDSNSILSEPTNASTPDRVLCRPIIGRRYSKNID